MKDLVTERLKLKDLYPERAEALAKEHKIDVEDLELVRKGVIAEAPEVNRDERAVISFINMDTVDRDNEIIDPEGVVLTHFRKNPVVPYGHDYRGLPMGKNMWVKKATNKKGKKGLLAKTVFLKRPAINEELYHLYSDDVAGTGPALNGWSIGFIPLKWEEVTPKEDLEDGKAPDKARKKYTKWELIEYSGVMVPSNREALTEMVEKGLIKSEKLKKDIIEIELEELDNDSDLITKPEETNDFIRIPVRDCKVTATITISEKQGITALYCGKIKKIRTYIFDKRPPYNWTMAKAKKWVEEHGKAVQGRIDLFNQLSYFEFPDDGFEQLEEVVNMDSQKQLEELVEKAKYNCECIKCGWKHTSEKHCNTYKCEKCGGTMRRVGRPGPGQESGEVIELEENEIKGVIPFKETSKAPEGEKWDGPREIREAEVSDLKIMATWFDSENPDIKSSYKLPHHKAKGHAVVWRAVAASMVVLFGARGGVDVPSGDRKGIFGHLSKHYKQFDKEPPEFREYTEREIDEWSESLKALESTEEEPKQTEREQQITRELFDRLTEQLNKVEEELKALKEGRVLSAKNRKLIQDALAGMEAAVPPLKTLLTATEPPQREEFEIDIDLDKTADDKKARVDSTTADDKIEINSDSLTENIASILREKIETLVVNRINKLKGKVE